MKKVEVDNLYEAQYIDFDFEGDNLDKCFDIVGTLTLDENIELVAFESYEPDPETGDYSYEVKFARLNSGTLMYVDRGKNF